MERGAIKRILFWMIFGFAINFLLAFIARVPSNLRSDLPFYAYEYYTFIAALTSTFVFLLIGLISEFYFNKNIRNFYKLRKSNVWITIILVLLYLIGHILWRYFLVINVYFKLIGDIFVFPVYLLFLAGLLGNTGWLPRVFLLLPLILFWYYTLASLIVNLIQKIRSRTVVS